MRIGRPPHVGSRRYLPWIGEPEPHGHAAPLTAGIDIEPSQDRRDVLIDGFLGRDKALGDLSVAQPVRAHRWDLARVTSADVFIGLTGSEICE